MTLGGAGGVEWALEHCALYRQHCATYCARALLYIARALLYMLALGHSSTYFR